MNKLNYIIRRETKNDYREVENLAREAFWNLSVMGCNEHYFVQIEGKIIAFVMYSESKLTDENNNEKTVLTMGPICVHPDFQRKGYGKILLEHTFRIACEMGYDTVINFGNPDNYVARGYKSCKKYNICLEGDIFPAALLVKELRDNVFDGRKWYYHQNDADKPCEDEKAVEEFDRLFPPKIKNWQPSQEEFYIHSHSAITW